jgi:hypothetical protein
MPPAQNAFHSAMLRRKGKTCSEMILNIVAGSRFFSRDQRISS